MLCSLCIERSHSNIDNEKLSLGIKNYKYKNIFKIKDYGGKDEKYSVRFAGIIF